MIINEIPRAIGVQKSNAEEFMKIHESRKNAEKVIQPEPAIVNNTTPAEVMKTELSNVEPQTTEEIKENLNEEPELIESAPYKAAGANQENIEQQPVTSGPEIVNQEIINNDLQTEESIKIDVKQIQNLRTAIVEFYQSFAKLDNCFTDILQMQTKTETISQDNEQLNQSVNETTNIFDTESSTLTK